MRKLKLLMLTMALGGMAFLPRPALAQTPEPRLAFVVGNTQYLQTPLPTGANDAALIAETLRGVGFDVMGAADLDQESFRRAFKEFLTKVAAAGPGALTFVYLSGYGLQYAGENYFAPLGATLEHDKDIPTQTVRISDLTHALAGMPSRGRVFVLDAARTNPFATAGEEPLAPGLALADVEQGALFALDAAPDTLALDEKGPFGAYAKALAEMLRYGGLSLDDVFARTRLRVNETTHGAFIPWDVSKLDPPIVLLAPAATADSSASDPMHTYATLGYEPIRDFPEVESGYAAAIELDTLSAYQEFLAAFSIDPRCPRVAALLAHRREALTWNFAYRANSPSAYWSYMRRYPNGPHLADAHRLLAHLGAALDPPQRFDSYEFHGLAAPEDEEQAIINHPPFVPGGPDYAAIPGVPTDFLSPLPPEFRRLSTPEPQAPGILPVVKPLGLFNARGAPKPGSLTSPNFDPEPAEAQATAPNAAGAQNAVRPNGHLDNPLGERSEGLAYGPQLPSPGERRAHRVPARSLAFAGREHLAAGRQPPRLVGR